MKNKKVLNMVYAAVFAAMIFAGMVDVCGDGVP